MWVSGCINATNHTFAGKPATCGPRAVAPSRTTAATTDAGPTRTSAAARARDDERSGALTAAVVDVLLHYLPSARPQLVSAADTRRIGVLIATDQQDVAIMQAEGAEALFLAKPPFADITEAPLRTIVSFGSHRFRLPGKLHGQPRLSAGKDAGRARGAASGAERRCSGARGSARVFRR